MSNQTYQKGLSITELMISLAISSFLILGITQIYIDNKSSQIFQNNQSGNLHNGRLSTLIIDKYLGKAGYRRNPSSLQENVFSSSAAEGDCLAFEQGHAVTGLNSSAGIGFCIRYQPQSSAERDCNGNTSSVTYTEAFPDSLVETDMIILAFKYVAGDDGALENGQLQCKNLNVSSAEYSELISGIADMRLDFGIGDADDTAKEITSYISHSDWTAASGIIRSLRYQLLLTSSTGQRSSDESKVFDDWLSNASEDTKSELQSADNLRIYSTVGSTQTLRNLMP